MNAAGGIEMCAGLMDGSDRSVGAVTVIRDVRLEGHEVTLVDLTLDHVPSMFELTCGEGNEPLWTYMSAGPFRTSTELGAYVQKQMRNPTTVPLAIIGNETGRVVGTASYWNVSPVNGSIEIGSIVYSPEMQHHRGGTESIYLMARHAIDELGSDPSKIMAGG